MIIFGVDFSEGYENWLGGSNKYFADQNKIVKRGGEYFYNLDNSTDWVSTAWHWLKYKEGFNLSMRIHRESTSKYEYFFTTYDGSTYYTGLFAAIFDTGVLRFQIGHGADSDPRETRIETPENSLLVGETADFEFIFDRLAMLLIIKKNGTEIARTAALDDMYTTGLQSFIIGNDPRRSGRFSTLLINNIKLSAGVEPSADGLMTMRNGVPIVRIANRHGSISGKVLIKGAPTSRQVICMGRVNKKVMATTWSDSAGNYRFDNLVKGSEYVCLAIDHTRNYNAVVQDMLRAE